MEQKAIYKAINAVMEELSKEGISKNRKNQQQGYAFRGIDDIYNTLSELLSKNGIVIYPVVKSREQTERKTKNDTAAFYTNVIVEYHVCSSVDGSEFVCCTAGEAMDSADKSTNKAMSAAYKYLCLQLFCIPTEGDNDADATTPEPVKYAQPSQQKSPEAQYVELLNVKGIYTDELRIAFNKMTLDQKRAEYERVKGL